MVICIITDDLIDVRHYKIANILSAIEKVIIMSPMYEPSRGQSLAITTNKSVVFQEIKTEFKEIRYNSTPADAFIFSLDLDISFYVFGPNDDTHVNFGNIISSTVALLNLAKYAKKRAFSISGIIDDYYIAIEQGLQNLEDGYNAYNYFKLERAIPSSITLNIPDRFFKIQLTERKGDWYYLSYKQEELGEDANYKERKQSFYVKIC